MQAIEIKKHTAAILPGITISPDVKDYSNDPGFQKHNEMAQAFIEKHGLPKLSLKKR